jgi:hypothetical protein
MLCFLHTVVSDVVLVGNVSLMLCQDGQSSTLRLRRRVGQVANTRNDYPREVYCSLLCAKSDRPATLEMQNTVQDRTADWNRWQPTICSSEKRLARSKQNKKEGEWNSFLPHQVCLRINGSYKQIVWVTRKRGIRSQKANPKELSALDDVSNEQICPLSLG